MNILITGGSRGIGREAALYLSGDKDNQILITGRDESALRKVSEMAKNENIFYYVFDLNKLGSGSALFFEHCSSLFSIVDILINNAGLLIHKEFLKLTDNELKLMMEINFFAPATLIRTVRPLMRKGGHIINISSMGGFQGSVKFAGMSGYSSSKAAIACLTECLALEFSEDGISVNCLAPGSVQTEMLAEAFPGYNAPVTAAEMGEFVGNFALNGNKFFNGKILPMAVTTP